MQVQRVCHGTLPWLISISLDLNALVTIREYLNQHIRRATILCWIAMPVALASPFIWPHGRLRVFALVIVAIALAIGYRLMFSARCPRCRTRLLLALGTFGVRLRIPPWYTSCPSCGLSFDTQCAGTQQV
jgi:hypothetical protein